MQAGNLRGRTFRQSDNPMYMTSKNSAEAAYGARALITRGLVAKERGVPPVGPSTYHYETVSSNYGTQISNSDSYVARAMDPLRKEPPYEPMNVDVLKEMGVKSEEPSVSAVITLDAAARERRSQSWAFKSKPQNPLYTTTSYSIGYKKPEPHELADKIFPMQNKFTETFSGIQYRDQGLNCAIDRGGYIDKGENAW